MTGIHLDRGSSAADDAHHREVERSRPGSKVVSIVLVTQASSPSGIVIVPSVPIPITRSWAEFTDRVKDVNGDQRGKSEVGGARTSSDGDVTLHRQSA